MTLPKIVTDLFTGPDGHTWHMGRFGAAMTVISGLPLPWVQLWRTGVLDLAATGVFYSGVAAGAWAMAQGAKNMDLMPEGSATTTTTTTTETL